MLPLLATLRRRVVGPHAYLGWLLVVIGLIGWQVFGRHADWVSLFTFRGPLEQVRGVVIGVNPSGFTVGGEFQSDPIHAVRFSFEDSQGIRRQGVSWTDHPPPQRGDPVPVQFVESEPDSARIVGFRSGPLPLWVGAVLLFPAHGLICLVQAMRRAEHSADS